MPRPDGFEKNIAINAAVLTYPNGACRHRQTPAGVAQRCRSQDLNLSRAGTVSVTYRGAVDDGFGNCVAESWRSPCVRPARNMFPDPRCERSNGSLWPWLVVGSEGRPLLRTGVGTEDPFSYKG